MSETNYTSHLQNQKNCYCFGLIADSANYCLDYYCFLAARVVEIVDFVAAVGVVVADAVVVGFAVG